MKRTPLLRTRSKRRRGEAEKRRDVVTEVLARDGGCRAPAAFRALGVPDPFVCWGQLDPHEPIAQGRGGDPLDPEEIVVLCRGHHSLITDDPLLAEELGLGRTAGGHPGWLQAKRDVALMAEPSRLIRRKVNQ